MKEIWKEVVGYEGRYQISSKGRVKSMANSKGRIEKILKGGINSTGYVQVNLTRGKKAMHLVSRLVCIAFLPNTENKPQVNHKDGDKLNNRLENLEWISSSENHKHAYKCLGRKLTSNHVSVKGRKLSKEDVIEIRAMFFNNSIKEISHKYNVSTRCIYNIRSNDSYKDVI